jgi:hypothetical protein
MAEPGPGEPAGLGSRRAMALIRAPAMEGEVTIG